ncbi:DUF421 domain-containing protein [Thomasclavelia cocleata]|uniref:Uncharacterized membrane protein YcaP, DUF421 family n=1 Tax=Thomasclavelia cocleata TaxID=69824 RepID=A0A1I0H7M5_9FIRM|nr:DUF421 domain-containing protein [Thomasclavelia cocleata]MCR1959993.1 DUF421 domain-containing protein [Thomasclavelia cocleata]NDO41664.1 DUF421 domain-containing protein [Thomasclavelia cocleata]PJN79705.1 DUF421 domain-containing protein [Thomasclavelia cocleata]SET79764.1 Uncharacterized membrane protein YcaP, DUF421 family [Thomasclavelia cocleata]
MQILEYIIIPIISLVVLFIITKMMGYRQVSQLNMYDYINGITIGSIASELVMGGFDNILQPLIAMIVYAIVIIFLSKAAASSLKLRKLIDGQAVVLYENDQIYNEELEKAKLDLDEFLMQCRIAGYFNLNELQTVVLETNGSFSFFPKEKYRPAVVNDLNITINKVKLPTVLIKQGIIFHDNLSIIGQDETWLENELNVRGIPLSDVILMFQEDNSNLAVYSVNEVEKVFD